MLASPLPALLVILGSTWEGCSSLLPCAILRVFFWSALDVVWLSEPGYYLTGQETRKSIVERIASMPRKTGEGGLWRKEGLVAGWCPTWKLLNPLCVIDSAGSSRERRKKYKEGSDKELEILP